MALGLPRLLRTEVPCLLDPHSLHLIASDLKPRAVHKGRVNCIYHDGADGIS
jgi:hypothetical protein